MRQDEIDLERAINDPDYRRQVIRRLNADAAQRAAAPGEPPGKAVEGPAGRRG